MRINPVGEHVFSEHDLVDLIMTGHNLCDLGEIVTEEPPDLSAIQFCVDTLPRFVAESKLSVADYDRANQAHWLMPDQYQDMDIVKHVLSLCRCEAELQRAGEELLLYADRNLLDLLKYLVFLVDTMRANSVIWGVGRGSSVASFVLYLLGVHRINSLEFDLDVREFLR